MGYKQGVMEEEAQNIFNSDQLETVNQAVIVAEDIISDRFQLTISSWKKYRYDIQTLAGLIPAETAPDVFAQIVRYVRPAPWGGLRPGDFYRICLQDHNILAALDREPKLRLFPLMVYVLTHELVHIVRFYKFFQFFDADENDRRAEEVRVHRITYDMLRKLNLSDLAIIMDFYARHREMVF
ncbi:MAG: hypothetical protein V1816_12845 [Pseudomonadota bacterium]